MIHNAHRQTGNLSESAIFMGLTVTVLGCVLGVIVGHQFDAQDSWAFGIQGLQIAMLPSALLGYYTLFKL